MKQITYALCALFCSITLLSCNDTKVYDTLTDIPNAQWSNKNELNFPFTIENSSASYSLYYTIRYNQDYPFYNLYVNKMLCDSSGKEIKTQMQGMDIFHPQTGLPRGEGAGSEKTFLILSDSTLKFSKPGMYQYKIKQYMRTDTLRGVSAFGIRILKNE